MSDCVQPVPVWALVTATVGTPQLSAKAGAVKAALMAVAVGLQPMLASAPSAVATTGAVVSITLVVAGEVAQAGLVLVAPAAVDPQAAAKT